MASHQAPEVHAGLSDLVWCVSRKAAAGGSGFSNAINVRLKVNGLDLEGTAVDVGAVLKAVDAA